MPLNPDPHRRTFHETCAELGLTQDELMRCVAEGKIVPTIPMWGRHTLYSILIDGPEGKPFRMELCTEDVNGAYFLVHRRQKSPMSCIWLGFSTDRTADEGENFYAFNDDDLRSEMLPELCYFLVEEIARFRENHVIPHRMNTKAEANFTSSERTMKKLALGMAIAHYGYDPRQKRSPSPGEIAAELERVGCALHVDTIRDALKKAARDVASDQSD